MTTTTTTIEKVQNYKGTNSFIIKMKEVGIEKISNSCGMDASSVFEVIGLINDNLELLLGALR